MAHDVFISYPSENKPVADVICNILESKHIRCWIAPRDILPGQEYAKAVYNAIDSCKIFVLVFSGETNYSRHIMSEVQRAFNKNLIIMPFRIENIEPSIELEYYIGPSHWLDAVTPPLEKHIEELAKAVQLNLENKGDSLSDLTNTRISSDRVQPSIKDKNLGFFRPLNIAVFVILSLICLVVVVNYAILPMSNGAQPSTSNDGMQSQPTTGISSPSSVSPAQVPTNGLVAYYSFDDGNAKDNSGNGYDGNIIGAISVDGFSGKALQFDGIDDLVILPFLFTDDPRTVSVLAFIKPEKYNSDPGVVFYSGNYEFNLHLAPPKNESSTGVATSVHLSDAWYSTYTTIPITGSWWHAAGTVDTNQNKICIYTNGTLRKEDSIPVDTFIHTPSGYYVSIGAYASEAVRKDFFKGVIDEVIVYDRVLTAKEIATIYNYYINSHSIYPPRGS